VLKHSKQQCLHQERHNEIHKGISKKKDEENSFKKSLESIKANEIGTLGGRILVVWLVGFCINA
jgi:hypothetical protein